MTDQPSAELPRVGLPDEAMREAARARQLRLTKPAGALGRLECLGAWAAAVQGACPPQLFAQPTVVVFAGDHGIARTAATSAYPPEVTAQMVLNFIAGGAAVNVLARRADAAVRVVDVSVDADVSYLDAADPSVAAHRIRRGSGSIDREDAMTLDEAQRAFALGRSIADREIDAGADLLIPGDMGIGNTTPAAALVGLLTSLDAAKVTGTGTGIDDATWMRKCAAVRDAMRRGRPLLADPIALLAAIGGADLAAMTGFILQAAVRRTPVILDGTISGACAMLADRLDFRARQWWVAGHQSTEPAHRAALHHLDLEPLLDYELRLGEGTGALLALPVLQAAIATLGQMATFDEAGVSDRDA
ncbi:MAG: nicotinate-nucleotide--dimethylbenzimidazole phosphoribosyltransferase [Candidatus Nanopelagicales bacterium]|nr:nicotinate-nucleotide--dimethylbenzimidazole phosphoribosyltransferase [Candidatus Nanopelagicales bacterium]